jgi:hypothetical protein
MNAICVPSGEMADASERFVFGGGMIKKRIVLALASGRLKYIAPRPDNNTSRIPAVIQPAHLP